MTDHRVFVVVAVRLIGLTILLISAPTTLGWILTAVQEQRWTAIAPHAAPRFDALLVLIYLAYIIEPLLGLYLLLDGRWVMRRVLAGLPNGGDNFEELDPPPQPNKSDLPNE